MKQPNSRTLAVVLACPADIAVGDPVEISGSLACAKPAAAASIKMVGLVEAHALGATECTVWTRFRERRDDRVAAAEVPPGPFVFDATMKLVKYTGATFGYLLGTATEPFLPVTGVTDTIKCHEEGQSAETFVLAATDVTAVLIANKINATALHVVASAVAGALKIAAKTLDKDLILEAVTHDDYTELGLTASTGAASARSHDPGSIAGLVISDPATASLLGTVTEPYVFVTGANDKIKLNVGSGGSQTFTMAAATDATAQDVADTINATATDVTASAVDGRLKLTVDDPWTDLEIEAVTHDCYDDLGLTAAVTAAPMIVETLEK
jgi:hypothetical protein